MVSLSTGFFSADVINTTLPQPLPLPGTTAELLGHTISALESGCINMIEANSLRRVHHELHKIMVEAVADNWKITMIDLANCFNPQEISTIAFDYDLHGQLVLQQIGLARPFQIHQAVSIIRDLVRQIEQTAEQKNLIVITDISSLFFDPAVANEDPQFPLPQLEMLRQCVGILQSLAVQGHMVLITDRTERTKSIPTTGEVPQIKAASLQYSSKLHLQLTEDKITRLIRLVSHPYLPATTKRVEDLDKIIRTKTPKRQLSLDQFF